MASTAAISSASTVRCLPLIDCPKCKIKVVRRKSKAGNVYYKCPNNFLNDDTFKEYWFEDQYLEYLRANHPNLLEGVEVDFVQPTAFALAVLGAPVGTEQNSDRMVEMLDMKVQITD
ncbi:unnamed protein product [Miscanthus lutarioriparius]|uniref:Uncharacterized protein n=1 Tax=Miscanthus lutarioriparius TaxID=422564 RepID=A0A811QX32_9POAL|nr:unnamed protein product [Miscanthus lutarioriparius]